MCFSLDEVFIILTPYFLDPRLLPRDVNTLGIFQALTRTEHRRLPKKVVACAEEALRLRAHLALPLWKGVWTCRDGKRLQEEETIGIAPMLRRTVYW